MSAGGAGTSPHDQHDQHGPAPRPHGADRASGAATPSRRRRRAQLLAWADASLPADEGPSLEDLRSALVRSSDGEEIGRVGEVYLDDLTGEPEWITVRVGRLRAIELFVPLGLLDLVDGALTVPYTRELVRRAPHLQVDGDLTPREELELRRHYGVADAHSTGDGSGLAVGAPQPGG